MADMLDDHENRIKALEEGHKKQKSLHDGLHTRVIKNEDILGDHLKGRS